MMKNKALIYMQSFLEVLHLTIIQFLSKLRF